MSKPIRIIGNYLSPYVRKVLACLQLKGLQYEIDPITPFFGNDEFTRMSPLRRIPVLIDGDTVLSDSTVICEYLNEQYPSPALLPSTPAERARARWFEEFADTRMGDVFIWRFYNQVVIRRYVWNEAPDEAIVKKALQEEIPGILDYLESLAPQSGFLFGTIGVADIALATFFRNAQFARWTLDASRWPHASRYIERVLAHECLSSLRPFEDLLMRTPIAEQRSALRAAGAPVSEQTVGSQVAQRGVMQT